METLSTYNTKKLEQTEEELIAAAKQDRRQFEPLYLRYRKRIFLFIYHRVGDKALAADIASQVFLKAMANLDSYVYKGLPFSAWLFRIAINECNAHFRKASTHFLVLDDHHSELLHEEIHLNFEDDNNDLSNALKSLNHDEITLIELRFFEGLKFAEIAEVLSITENNSKVKLYRILDKLKKKIKYK